MTTRIPTAEAAERLGTTPRTVRRWFDTGRLAGELAGDRLLIEVPFRPGEPQARSGPSVPSVTTTEAGRRLGMTRAGVIRALDAGRLRGERVGKQLWITEASLAAYERLHRDTPRYGDWDRQ
jgi:hypothetical protein